MEFAKLLTVKSCITPFFSRTSLILKKNTSVLSHVKAHNFSSLTSSQDSCTYSKKMFENLDLVPHNPLLIPACGMKVRGQLELRCKNCYFERKDGQLYVNCTSYPRHKQAAMRKRLKYQWILTYAFQSKKRPY